MDDHVGVAIRPNDADGGMGIDAVNGIQIRCIDSGSQHSAGEIIEGCLAAFLPPRPDITGILDGKLKALVGDVLYHRVMPEFVGNFKNGNDDAINSSDEDVS